MSISVIIPVGPGRINNLRLVLFALEQQSFSDFETVVVTNDEETADVFGCHYVYNQSPNLGAINRNAGVRLAKYNRLVFIDSDVVLHRDALLYYNEGFTNFENRAILGLYHWLPPREVTKEDIIEWDALANAEIVPNPGRNIGRDGREQFFLQTHQDILYCDYYRSLHCLSGNMGISRACYEHAGGFDEELSRGIDGAFGIALCSTGHSWSYDRRIVGLHLWHERYQLAMAIDPFPIIIRKWHSDDSWIGRMTWGKTWEA